MSVRRRKWRDPTTGALKEVWMVDIVFEHADGRAERVRKVAPVQTRRDAEAYERQLRASLLAPAPQRKEVPTLSAFMTRYMEGHAKANRQKASSIATKKSIFENHLIPRLGPRRLDQITDEDIQQLKAGLADRHRKTVNNVLTVLSNVLRVAVKWKVIAVMPCAIDFYKVQNLLAPFYEFEEYERLIEAAGKIDTPTLVAILLEATRGCVGARSSPCAASTSTFADASSRSKSTTGRASWTRPRAAAAGWCPSPRRSSRR
jgi:Phage integrase, N-terminal SAM-like domain